MAKKSTSTRGRTAKATGSARKASAAKSAAPKAKKAAPTKKASAAAKPAKKATASAKAPAKAAAKPRPAVKAKAPVKAKAAAKAAPKAASARSAKTKAPVKAAPKAAKARAAKPKAATAPAAPVAAQREHVDRQAPESLRLRAITPGFTVGDVERSRKFYVEGLGFTVKETWESEGTVQGLMLVAGGCELAIGQDDWAKGRDRVKGIGVRLYLDTSQDLDAIGARAIAQGITVDGPHDTSWGARTISVTDPDGFNLTFQRYTSG